MLRSEDGASVEFSNSSTNKQRVVVQLACGKHTHTLQVRSLIRSFQRALGRNDAQQVPGMGCDTAPATALYCKRCDIPCAMPGAMTASESERRLYCLLQSRFSDLQWQHEERVCGRAVDVWVPALKLVIQVDGAHHFWGSDGQQASSDRQHEEAVLNSRGAGQVKGLLRLHHREGNDVWERCTAWVLVLARDATVISFVVYSPHFGRKPRTVLCTDG